MSEQSRSFAQQAMQQSYQSIPAAPQEPDLTRWQHAIANLADRAGTLAADIASFGDELFGSEPTPMPGGKQQAAEPRCVVDAMEAQIDRLQNHMTDCENRYRRLRRLA
jgi:hypothetical protein